MIQTAFLSLVFLLAAALILTPIHTNAQCNLCNEHGIACINETSFKICSGGQTNSNKIFKCPSSKVCVNTIKRCADAASNVKPACEPTKGCGKCDGNKIFACISRNRFALCNDGVLLTESAGVCSDGLVCDSNGGEICKNECNRSPVIECDLDAPL